MAENREKMDRSVPLPTTAEQRADLPDVDRAPTTDPADEIPVPIAMSAAEIDERAQAVEAVRGSSEPESVLDPLLDPNDDSRADA